MLPNKNEIEAAVKMALTEDIGTGDVTAQLISTTIQGRARLLSRVPAVVCGQAWVNEVFHQVNPQINIEWKVKEGDWQAQSCDWAEISGPLRDILTAERTALNFLQTLSAVATKTRDYVQLLKDSNTKILDTRKTIPGLRLAQKYAVLCGGGQNHRIGLYDEFLIKENHIEAMGSITAAVTSAKAQATGKPITVEVQNIQELIEARAMLPTRIMLDNFTDEMIREAIKINTPKTVAIEVSGGITASRIQQLAQFGVDCISVGDLTKSITAIDLSLLVTHQA
jgi:nicotinate-nucleotide pyrophosphorylase (carboxylating)